MKRTFLIGVIAFVFPFLPARAQDSLQLLRQFVAVCTGYQQLPLHLRLELQNSTNFVLGAEDTARLEGDFYLTKGHSYIRLGTVEQLLNDSQTLVVSSDIDRMVLLPNHQPVEVQLQQLSGIAGRKAPLSYLMAKYQPYGSPTAQAQERLVGLASRHLLRGTTLPMETIEVRYAEATGEPVRLEQVNRSLMPLDSAVYRQLAGRADLSGHLIELQGEGYFLVRERRTVYAYKQIQHDPQLVVPVQISDRVRSSSPGVYEPLPAYAAYTLTQNQ